MSAMVAEKSAETSAESKTGYMSPSEYLDGEEHADHKSEYHDGKIAALPGASPAHIAITTNIAGELRMQMRGRPYRVFANHLRIKIEATGFYTYPDVAVICDKPIVAVEGEHPNTVLNPIFIVEVASEATEADDRTKKLDNYQQIPSLREYLLVSERERRITSYLREKSGSWVQSESTGPNGLIYLASIDCTLASAEIYCEVDSVNP